MTAPALFIGGTADGKRLVPPDGCKVSVVPAEAFQLPGGSIRYHRHTYREHRIMVDQEVFTVWVWTDLAPAEAMRLLIEKYPTP
jgi:hypothetical protein